MKAAVINVRRGANLLIDTEPEVEARKRAVELRWSVGKGVDRFDREVEEVATLSCYHHGDAKCFTATLRREQHDHEHGIWSTMIHLNKPDAFRIRENVARYSDKAMLAFVATATESLRLAGQEPGVLDVFGVDPVTTVLISEKPSGQRTLEWLQSLVGGDIEPVLLEPGFIEGYVNEEGKYQDGGLTPNPVATAFRDENLKAAGAERLPDDFVAGPLVVVGRIDEDGETTGITPAGIARVLDFVTNAALVPEPV